MSSESLVSSLDVFKFADKCLSIQGQVEAANLLRIHDIGAKWLSPFRVSFSFARDDQRRVVISGSLGAVAEVECQRCLECFELPVDIDVNTVLVVSDEQLRNLPRELEAYEFIGGDSFSLYDFIEEEVLLHLPQIHAHPLSSDCSAAALDAFQSDALVDVGSNHSENSSSGISDAGLDAPEGATQVGSAKQNPFAVLSVLKNGLKKD